MADKVDIEREILTRYRNIAVVGLSSQSNRDSNRVAHYLKKQGYRIIPVNPNETEVLGERAYPDLRSVPVPVEIVDIFRRTEYVPEIVEDAIAVGAKAVWMQLEIIHEEAARRARESGLLVVMDRCTLVEHRRLVQEGKTEGLPVAKKN